MIPINIAEDVESQRADLAAVCRRVYGQGWMPGTSGNISVRSAAAVLITASGRGKGTMDAADTVLVDPVQGLPLTGESEWPSAETAIHLAVYRHQPACAAVIHAHSPWATTLASVTGPSSHAVFEELELAKGIGVEDPGRVHLPVFTNWPDVTTIAAEVDTHLRSTAMAAPALLIDRHGVTVWGRDLDEAANRLECIEELSRLTLQLRLYLYRARETREETR